MSAPSVSPEISKRLSQLPSATRAGCPYVRCAEVLLLAEGAGPAARLSMQGPAGCGRTRGVRRGQPPPVATLAWLVDELDGPAVVGAGQLQRSTV